MPLFRALAKNMAPMTNANESPTNRLTLFPIYLRVASLAFLKPNNSNLASVYNIWLRKILFGLKLFFGFFWLFFLKSKKKLVFSANFSFSCVKLVKAALRSQMLTPK